MTQDLEAAAGYRGRFAPSPTGPLHFGSLVAATASYLDAKTKGGVWLVRMEDVDRTRTVPGAADAILTTLEAFGFAWDEEVIWQSERDEAYREALALLERSHAVYPCGCTRREIAEMGEVAEDGSARYPGTCRNGLPPGKQARAWRIRVDDAPIRFEDGCQGALEYRLATDVGDFVLLRADGLIAYQLAVVVDDAFQRVTDIVRGADLLSSTPRQIQVQRALALPTPRYFHVPVAEVAPGSKLSKQTLAPALDADRAGMTLWNALQFLGQEVPFELRGAAVEEIWHWAFSEWRPERVPRVPGQVAPPIGDMP